MLGDSSEAVLWYLCKIFGQVVLNSTKAVVNYIDFNHDGDNGEDSARAWKPYKSFISYTKDQDTEHGIEHWEEYVKGIVPCHFPVMTPRSDQQTGSRTVHMSFDASQFRTFCQRFGVFVYSVLQTAWGLVLRTFVGQDQVCFGCVTSGRDMPVHRAEDAIGPYINMLICQVEFNPLEPIPNVLRQTHDDFISGLSHQHSCCLARIQHELKVSRKHCLTA